VGDRQGLQLQRSPELQEQTVDYESIPMKHTIVALEVKQGQRKRYVGTFAWGSHPKLVESILDAGNFFNSPQETIDRAAGSFRLPTDKVYAFSATSVDSIDLVEVEVAISEVSRKSVRS
jgi:hypothetical protein